MKQLKYNSDIIARLSDLLFRISNDVRGVGKHASMVQTQLEQVAKSQRELLDEMNHNMHDFAVSVATRGGKMTQEPLYPEGHPKRIEQDSQRANTSAPSPSKKKTKKKNDRTLHTSRENQACSRGSRDTQKDLNKINKELTLVLLERKRKRKMIGLCMLLLNLK